MRNLRVTRHGYGSRVTRGYKSMYPHLYPDLRVWVQNLTGTGTGTARNTRGLPVPYTNCNYWDQYFTLYNTFSGTQSEFCILFKPRVCHMMDHVISSTSMQYVFLRDISIFMISLGRETCSVQYWRINPIFSVYFISAGWCRIFGELSKLLYWLISYNNSHQR